MRVLVLSHGHPEFGGGGAERAAYSLFRRLKADPSVEAAVFVARAEHNAIGHSAFFGAFRSRPDEILACPPPLDPFTFQTQNYDLLRQLVGELVAAVRPDVVHMHHFLHWGLETVALFKAAGVRVVLTLHEFAAICAHYGQMIKTDGRLCHAASPAECSLCIPSASAGKFFVRRTIAQNLLEGVDAFVSPSRFLKDRYVAWGIPGERIAVIENVLDPDRVARLTTGALPASGGEGRRAVVGFFGQINPFKGVDVLLKAATLLPEAVRERIEIRLHGENKHFRDDPVAKTIDTLMAKVGDVVTARGAYRNEDVVDLMAACDWVVVPSIWWENSPVVIQEARLAGRPLILSAIGGMAEKAAPGLDRLSTAGSPEALAAILGAIADGTYAPDSVRLATLTQDTLMADRVAYAAHLPLYGMAAAQTAAEPSIRPARRRRLAG